MNQVLTYSLWFFLNWIFSISYTSFCLCLLFCGFKPLNSPTVNLEWQEPSSHLHTQEKLLFMPMSVFPVQTERPSSNLGWKKSIWRSRIAAKQCKWNSPCHFQYQFTISLTRYTVWRVSWHKMAPANPGTSVHFLSFVSPFRHL